MTNPSRNDESRYITADAIDPRERFVLYRLCDCPTCGGRGQLPAITMPRGEKNPPPSYLGRCPDCRGEGKVRQELATCESPEAVGVAIVTLGREGEWENCPLGLLDRTPECETCGGRGRESFRDAYPDQPSELCAACNGSGVKPTGTWLIRPWLPSPRNASDAGKLLRSRRK